MKKNQYLFYVICVFGVFNFSACGEIIENISNNVYNEQCGQIHEYPMTLSVQEKDCVFEVDVSLLNNCTVTKVEHLVTIAAPVTSVSMDRTDSTVDASSWMRIPSLSGEEEELVWTTIHPALNCSSPLGCGNGHYVATVVTGGIECAANESTRATLRLHTQ